MLVSFRNAGFTRGDLLDKPTEPHAGYTQRRGAYAIEASRVNIQCKVPFTGGVYRWRGRFLYQARRLQWQQVSSGLGVWQGSKRDPWHSQAPVPGGWSSEFLQSNRGRCPTDIGVQMESLPKCPDV